MKRSEMKQNICLMGLSRSNNRTPINSTTPKDIPCVIAAAGVIKNGNAAPASSRGPVAWKGVRYFDSDSDEPPKSKPDVTGCFGGYPMWTRLDLWEGDKLQRLRVVHTDSAGYILATGPQGNSYSCLLYTSPSPRDQRGSRMPSSA